MLTDIQIDIPTYLSTDISTAISTDIHAYITTDTPIPPTDIPTDFQIDIATTKKVYTPMSIHR